MHILLTNDDGPLNDKASPYIKYLVDEINSSTDWKLSIVVPNQQRSWIGKAHFAGKSLTPSYIYTNDSTATPNQQVNAFDGPFTNPQPQLKSSQEWCLVDSTPAACADLGIYHLNSFDQPIDLVISGPNLGKNASRLYILSSGTVGASLEAATHGYKSISLSYEYYNLNHDYNLLKEAAKISVKLINKLYNNWDSNTDIYSINVPLVQDLQLGKTKIEFAPIYNNCWNSIYQPHIDEVTGQTHYNWNPDFKKVYKDGLLDLEHSDNRVLINKGVSVTPLKASFQSALPSNGEIILDDKEELDNIFLITINENEYIYKPLVEAFKNYSNFKIVTDKSILTKLNSDNNIKIFHYGDYEDIDIDFLQSKPNQYFIPSYIYRKALIRKHFLANTIHHFTVKNPESALKNAVPNSYQLEVDYAEFLDDALDDAYELRDEIENTNKTWILKPSMSDKGQGIRLFNTIDQLQSIFDSFEGDEEDEEEENDDKNGVIISQLRHFIVQEYQTNPLLLSGYDFKKFHLRTYVVCVGNLKVYVYKNILTLFSDSSFEKPLANENEIKLDGHLTNTCLQESVHPLVVPFWKLAGFDKQDTVYDKIRTITGELFRAATSVDKINFQPLPNAVEIYGVDFLVNDDLEVKLLEVNAYPDFKQTGDDLKDLIFELFDRVVNEAVLPLVTNEEKHTTESNLDLVYLYE